VFKIKENKRMKGSASGQKHLNSKTSKDKMLSNEGHFAVTPEAQHSSLCKHEFRPQDEGECHKCGADFYDVQVEKAKADERKRILELIRKHKKCTKLHKFNVDNISDTKHMAVMTCLDVVMYEIINSMRKE